MSLLLFDVDSTLVNSRGAGRLALARALQAAYGMSGEIEVIPLAGSTDWRAVREALTPAGLSGSGHHGRLARILPPGAHLPAADDCRARS
ncbi:MAG: hypothetical protein IPO15_27025 [Anaerolineae bacterium]|uniref:hypothetical protein n=1 Tax=Candidatus Amarolinea dominans TaxID=3140696 RepID=UPI003136889E|nr:hypothetical protein [Anaerolineae bacterium]